MSHFKKDARHIKKAVTIFISDEELFRVKQIAQTWGTNVSQMIAHLINQTYESKAYLNGYSELSQDEREGLKVRRAHVNFLTARRSEAARIRNFDRRNGLDRGLTNVMVIAAPEGLNGRDGKNFPGIFCKNLGEVWIVPYGLLERISVIEIIEYPCYASVFDYFAGNEIPKSGLTQFVNDKRDYVLSSFGEKAVLKRLFELYGFLRFPSVKQAEHILREQRDELSNRVTQYQRLLKKLREVQAQRAISEREWNQIKYAKLTGGQVYDDNGQPFDLSKSLEELKAIYDKGKEQSSDIECLKEDLSLTPSETLAALQSMMPEGAKVDPETLSRLQALADSVGEPNDDYFELLRDQIDDFYEGLDTFYDQDGELNAYQLLDQAKEANTYYETVNSPFSKFQNDEAVRQEDEVKLDDDVAVFEFVTPSDLAKSIEEEAEAQAKRAERKEALRRAKLKKSLQKEDLHSGSDQDSESISGSNQDAQASHSQDGLDGQNADGKQAHWADDAKIYEPLKPGRPTKVKPKVTRVALPRYLSNHAADMAMRVSKHVDMLKSQGTYPEPKPPIDNKDIPMPEVYGEEQGDKPFMPNQDYAEYGVGLNGKSNSEFGMGAASFIRKQDQEDKDYS